MFYMLEVNRAAAYYTYFAGLLSNITRIKYLRNCMWRIYEYKKEISGNFYFEPTSTKRTNSHYFLLNNYPVKKIYSENTPYTYGMCFCYNGTRISDIYFSKSLSALSMYYMKNDRVIWYLERDDCEFEFGKRTDKRVGNKTQTFSVYKL